MLSEGKYDVIGCCLGFNGDFDEYWATTWHTEASSAQIPDKVEIYVDGEKLAEKEGPFGNGIKGWDPATNMNALYTIEADDYVKINGVSGVASISGTEYGTLQAAIEAVQEGETIVVLNDFKFQNGANGTQNGISYTGGASFTLDLNGKTVTSDLGGNALRFKIGEGNDVQDTEVEITVQNGKVISGENNWCAISAATADNTGNKLVLNLENVDVESNKPGDFAIKSWAGAVVKAKNVNVDAKNGSGAYYAVGGEMVLDNCTADQKGLHTAPYMSMALGVSGGGKMTVNSGTYSSAATSAEEGYNQGTTHGTFVGGVMSSGGTLVINDGTFSNDNYGDDALATNARGLLFADRAGVVEVNGGVFNALKDVWDLQNNMGTLPNPKATITGGAYNADPRVTANGYNSNLISIADGYVLQTDDSGNYHVVSEKLLVDEIKLSFVHVTPADAEGERVYNINLTADGKIINRLNTVDLTFALTEKTGDMAYEIIESNDEIEINNVNNLKDRYEFHYDGKTDVDTDTAATITIGQVKFEGYGVFDFAVATADTNVAHATTLFDNIVDTFVPGGKLADGTEVGKFDVSDDTITDILISTPVRDLTINIDFPNAVENKIVAYQNMKVVVSGDDIEDIVIDLGSDVITSTIKTIDRPKAVCAAAFVDGAYVIEITDALTYNDSYDIVVSGAGYRTARYTVRMTDKKTVNFWNNVKDANADVEAGKFQAKKNFLAGDIVKDNNINVYDLSAVVSYFGETELVGNNNAYARYDLNRDGFIDSKDVAMVLVSWNN